MIELCIEYFKEKNYTNQLGAALSDRAVYFKEKGDLEAYEKSIRETEAMLSDIKSVVFKYAASSPVAKYYLSKDNPAKAAEIMNNLDISLQQIDWADRDNFLKIWAEIEIFWVLKTEEYSF